MKTILLLVFPGNNLKWNILMYFTENPYLTKVFFSICGSKCSWPIILRILWSVICQERIKFPTSSILLCVCVCVCVEGGCVCCYKSLPQQAGFSIMGALLSCQISSPPHESLSFSIITWNGILMSKKSLKFEQQIDLVLQGTWNSLPVMHIFTRNCN